MTIKVIQKPSVLRKNVERLTEEEEKSLQYLSKLNPTLENQYKHYLNAGRKGILHKLASSILRENILNLYEDTFELRKVGAALVVNLHEDGEQWRSFFKQIQHYPLKEGIVYKVTEVKGKVIVFPVEKEYAYQRVETTDEILLVDGSGFTPITLASDLLRVLFNHAESNYMNLETFIQELDNGSANLALAYMYEDRFRHEMKLDAKQINAEGTLDYVMKKMNSDSPVSPSLFFEQMVLDGHHLHPGAKTKLGLSKEEVIKYSPEFHQTFKVCFVAVRKTDMVTTPHEENYLIESYYKKELIECLEELEEKALNPEDYEIIPVHEWQYDHSIPCIYMDELKEGRVVLIEGVKLEAKATSSFRTVYLDKKGAPALKLAVNSQMTSTVRSISTQTALNSTRFTDMIHTVLAQEDSLCNFLPLNEIAGAAFHAEDELKSRNLTMLLRENIDTKLSEGELAISGQALYAKSPLSNQTILQELIEEYAKAKNLGERKAAHAFFENYVATIIPGYLTLMVKYGIALEGHLQNSVPVFKDGEITCFYFRDWGGARIYNKRLEEQGIQAEFTPGSISVTNEIDEMHNKLYYTVFQNHLGEIVRQLVKFYGLAEDELWSMVKQISNETFGKLAQDKGLEQNIVKDKAFLYQPQVKHKSLTKMRLTNGKGYSYSKVDNPLACEQND